MLHLPGEDALDKTSGGSIALGSVLLLNLWSRHLCGCYFDMLLLLKHCCRTSAPLHDKDEQDDASCIWHPDS